ncbi:MULTISPECIES: hypothetical protein [Acetobacter]|uniref:hypothetical protein n=1 Tax=Acetobacter TaxID=434 RepID=UPI000300D3D0|nr:MULTISPECIES: hypothetical protein [Acetobacter]KGB21795.1 hypothetical protein ApDm4_2702 [Acetobacter pomorum]
MAQTGRNMPPFFKSFLLSPTYAYLLTVCAMAVSLQVLAWWGAASYGARLIYLPFL